MSSYPKSESSTVDDDVGVSVAVLPDNLNVRYACDG